MSPVADRRLPAAMPVRVRISWASFATSLEVDVLSMNGVALTPRSTFFGGEVEFVVPEALLNGAPRLRWRLVSDGGSGAPFSDSAQRSGAPFIDEVRVEVCDRAGRWTLVGELLGQDERVWAQERQIHGYPNGSANPPSLCLGEVAC